MVHRDLKPSNIIFVNGAPKIADIGLVIHTGESGSYVGTYGYIPPEGPGSSAADVYSSSLKTSTFNEPQRKLLLELIVEWSGIIHDAAAAAKLEEIRANLADTWFAWSGPLEAGKAYFRVQGPTVIIEYAPQRLGGDVTMHIHSMYRDPTNDYGKKFTTR